MLVRFYRIAWDVVCLPPAHAKISRASSPKSYRNCLLLPFFDEKPVKDNMTDAELLKMLQTDSEKAIELFFNAHYVYLCRVCNNMIRDEEQSEDIVQEVFYDFWKKRNSIDINISVRAYLKRAVVNKTLNHIRDKKFKYQEDMEDHAEVFSSQPDILEQMNLEVLEDKIFRAIDDLPERCRIIFAMSRFEEMSYKEIAGQLDISIKTVENQISKALRLLRKAINE